MLKKIILRNELKWDMTQNKQFSVGDVTNNILKNLKKDVDIYVLYNDDSDQHSDEKSIMEFLNQYEKYGHVKVKKVNPDRNPGIIAEIDPDNVYDLHEDNIVVKCGNNIKKYFTEQLYMQNYYEANGVNKWDGEQTITGAIKYVTSEKKHFVYFTIGHDERKLLEEFKVLNNYIEKNNYETKVINLLEVEKVPNDADIIIFPSPKIDITEDEKDKMNEYLLNGGKAIFLFDYLDSSVTFPNFEKLMKNYSIGIDYDKVRENETNSVAKSYYNLIASPENNQINNTISGNMNKIIMPDCRSINILKNQKSNVTTLLKTSDSAIGEQIDKINTKDLVGALNLAVASENNNSENISKILVIGSCSFVTDSVVSKSPFSINFFMNSINWIQNNQSEITIEAKNLDFGTLRVDRNQANMISIFVIIIFPLIILGTGLIIWFRRKNL
jgi:hypothetical protein